tara:strand:- start:1340 stop:1798 length:459 start_codon:yes stop_codon:yes gene_type:complete
MKYSIALNSRDRVNGGDPNVCEFPFDFGRFKETKYEMSFTFVSDPYDMIDVVKTCSVFSNTGGSKVYTTSNVNMANTTQYIGSLRSGGHITSTSDDTDEQLIAGTHDNGAVYLDNAPREQTIKIRLLDGTGTAFTGVSNCPEWIMMLTFTEV